MSAWKEWKLLVCCDGRAASAPRPQLCPSCRPACRWSLPTTCSTRAASWSAALSSTLCCSSCRARGCVVVAVGVVVVMFGCLVGCADWGGGQGAGDRCRRRQLWWAG